MISIRTSGTRARFSRRAFLRSVGASAAMVPLLGAERAHAVGPTGLPKRLVTIAWGNGVAQPAFYSAVDDDPTANTIMQPLVSLKSKVTMVAGLDYKLMLDGGHTYDGHFSYPTMFTGTYKNLGGQRGGATGASIDQAMSDAIAKAGANLPMPLLNIQTAGQSTSFRADGTRNTGETNAKRLFTTMFANKTMTPVQVSALSVRRKSVLDYLNQNLSGFGNRLGTDDRAKIASHLESVRKLETQLTASNASASCMPVDPGAAGDYTSSMKAFADLVAMAFRCDVTRSVSMTWADDGGSGPASLPFLSGGGFGGLGDLHGIAHQGASGYPNKIKIDTWYMERLAYLANAINATPEGSGTMLDNSLIVMANDMTEGQMHSVHAIPILMVGTAGGALKAGRTVKVGSWAGKTGNYWSSGRTGVAHNLLLASISNMMDVPVPGFGTGYAGTLPGLA